MNDCSPIVLERDFSPRTRVRILSDLHLGHKKSFIQKKEQLLALLEGCDVLICNGDGAETRRGPFLEKALLWREEFTRLAQEEGKEVLFIGGNHDPDIPLRAAFLQQRRLFLMHGDAVFKTGAPWGREYLYHKKFIEKIIKDQWSPTMSLPARLSFAQEIAGALPAQLSKEWGKNKLVNFALHATWPPTRAFRILGSWLLFPFLWQKFVAKYAPESQVYVTGHMHRPYYFKKAGKVFINTGAFFNHARPSVLDLKGDSYSLSPLETFYPLKFKEPQKQGQLS